MIIILSYIFIFIIFINMYITSSNKLNNHSISKDRINTSKSIYNKINKNKKVYSEYIQYENINKNNNINK